MPRIATSIDHSSRVWGSEGIRVVAQHLAPIGSDHKCRYRIGEKYQHEPFEHVRYLLISEPNRCPRN